MIDKTLKSLLQKVNQNSFFTSKGKTWVLLLPSYNKQLAENDIEKFAQSIIKAMKEDYLWIRWPDYPELNYLNRYIPSHDDQSCIGLLKIENPKPGQEWRCRPIVHPILQMNSMFRHLTIAVKLYSLFKSMKLCFSNINDPIVIKNELDQIELQISKTDYKHSDLEDQLWNIFLAAISCSVLAFDESLSVLKSYICSKISVEDPFSQGLFIINQLRHAFAHGIRNPFWVIREKEMKNFKNKKISFYLSEDGNLADGSGNSNRHIFFDPKLINHKSFELKDVGGYGSFVLLLKFLFKKTLSLIEDFNKG